MLVTGTSDEVVMSLRFKVGLGRNTCCYSIFFWGQAYVAAEQRLKLSWLKLWGLAAVLTSVVAQRQVLLLRWPKDADLGVQCKVAAAVLACIMVACLTAVDSSSSHRLDVTTHTLCLTALHCCSELRR